MGDSGVQLDRESERTVQAALGLGGWLAELALARGVSVPKLLLLLPRRPRLRRRQGRRRWPASASAFRETSSRGAIMDPNENRIARFFRLMKDWGASDMHLSVGRPPMFRITTASPGLIPRT